MRVPNSYSHHAFLFPYLPLPLPFMHAHTHTHKQITRQLLTANAADGPRLLHAAPEGYLAATSLTQALHRLEHCIVDTAAGVRARVLVDVDARGRGPREGVVVLLERRWADGTGPEGEGENPFKGTRVGWWGRDCCVVS